MALTLTEAQTVQHDYFDKRDITQQVYEDDPFLSKLKRDNRVVWDGGNNIQFPIRYRKYGRANAVDPDSQKTFEGKVTRTAGVLSWTHYDVDSMITRKERMLNTGRSRIVNLLADKNTEMEQDMQDRFATDLYTTNPNGLGFISLDVIVDASASYAGIAVADASAWAGIEDTTTTVPALYGANSLAYSINQATLGRNSPDMIQTTRNLASGYESLIEPQKRYTDKETADAGFKNVTFHMIPIIGNPFVPSGYLYGLCTKVFELRYHPDFNFTPTPWTDLFQAGFPYCFGKLLSWAGNLVCKMRRCNFKYSALDYTLV
jgi:hypothetical protein